MYIVSSIRSDRQTDLALLALRVAIGVVFIAHGGQKLFVYGLAGVAGGFEQMGIPVPQLTGPLVGAVEFLGGIALVVGLLTRLAAMGLAINMLGAMFLVHLKNGFFLPGGIEFTMVLFAACVALMLAGPGTLSADGVLTRRRAYRGGGDPMP